MKQPIEVVSKGVEPTGGLIVPATMDGPGIGGFNDGKAPPRSMRSAPTALRGQGDASAAMTPNPPAEGTTPFPGQSGRPPASANAPARLLDNGLALGAQQVRPETAGLASVALRGGKVPLDPVGTSVPALPTPRPIAPGQPGGDALGSPPAGGFMNGAMRGNRGV